MIQSFDISNGLIIAPSVDLGKDFFPITPVKALEDIGNDIIIVEPFLLDFYTTTPYQWALSNGYEGTEAEFIFQWLSALNGSTSGGGGVFPDNTPTDVSLGAISVGSIIGGKTWQQIIYDAVYQEQFPTLINPSFSVSIIGTNIFEVNLESTLTLMFNYNMGSITPSYGTSGYRSGNVAYYKFGTVNVPFTSLHQEYSEVHTVSSPLNRTITLQAIYNEGPQPLSNKGNDYNTPYPSGVFSSTINTYYVFPYTGTIQTLVNFHKLPLVLMDSNFFELTVVAEDRLGNKQKASFSEFHREITGIQQYNTFSDTWEWVGGDKNYSLSTFTKTSIQRIVNGVLVWYVIYTHNGPTIGERKLRFYTT